MNEVFGTDAGKRILSQIIAMCEGLPITLMQVEQHGYLAHRAGMREVGLEIARWMNQIPVDIGKIDDGRTDY